MLTDKAKQGYSRQMDNKFAWTEKEIKQFGYQVVDMIAHHLTTLPQEPAFKPYPPELKQALAQVKAPQQGQDREQLLAEIGRLVDPYPFGNGHPRYFAWVNSQPAIISIFAEALAAAWNPSCAGGNHAATYIEHQVTRWFTEMIGLPAGSGGLFVSGGSMASLTALAVARHVKAGAHIRQQGLQNEPQRLLIYTSQEGHSCIHKAVELLGIGRDNIRLIPTDGNFRMDVAALQTAVSADLAAGHKPIAVVASAGTVNTGAIDPLGEITAVCRQHNLWLHVDGAYGAPAILTGPYRDQLAPLAHVDSLALDPHKWMYIPVEAGLVLLRDANALRDTFSLVPPYLRFNEDAGDIGGPPWFSEFGFQQTRGFKAFKVWAALSYHGWQGYQAALEHDIALANHLADLIRATPDWELIEPTSLSIVCFRHRPADPTLTSEALNQHNQAILKQVQLGGEVFLTGTTLRGQFVLRACVVNPRSSLADVEAVVTAVQDAANKVGAP